MLDFVCFVLIGFVFFDVSLKTKINILNTKKMRYKIVKMKKEEINNFHSCDLCECAHGNCVQNGVKLYNGFCDYPGECTVKENEYIKKVYK